MSHSIPSILNFLFGFLLLSAPSSAWAISEQNYAEDYARLVQPYFNQVGVEGSFPGVDGVHVSYRKFELPNEKGAVLIVSGRTESYIHYAELIYDLGQQGYSAYILDHRGQGFSGRMTPDSEVGYVRHFEDYVSDLRTFVDTVYNSKPHTRRFVLAHSMGGAIAALYLSEEAQRGALGFDSAVLSSPMFLINTRPFPEPIALAISDTTCALGLGGRYAVTQGPYNPLYQPVGVRSIENHQLEIANPVIQLGGASNRWVQQSLLADRKIKKLAHTLKLPILVLEAGRDVVVKTQGEERFCALAPRCLLHRFPLSGHAILMETDSIRDDAFAQMLAFFDGVR